LFTTPDGSPCECLLGVVPGQTPYKDAIAILDSHPLLAKHIKRFGNSIFQVAYLSNDSTLEMRSSRDGNAGLINLSLHPGANTSDLPAWAGMLPNQMTIGELITSYGGGQLLPVTNAAGNMTGALFVFPDSYLVFRTVDKRITESERLSPALDIEKIYLYSHSVYSQTYLNFASDMRKWRGFTTFQSYLGVPRP
jgi:hypothetical protein